MAPHKGSVPWNKGLTIKDPRVKKYCKPKKIEKKKCIYCKKEYTNHEVKNFGKAFKTRKFCSRKCWQKYRLKKKEEYWNKSHEELIKEEKIKWEQKGFKVISLSKVIPDLIVIKGTNFEVKAVEVERGTYSAKNRLKNKYKNIKYYDDVVWVFKKPKGIGRNKTRSS